MVVDRLSPLLTRVVRIIIRSRLVGILHHLLHRILRHAVLLDSPLDLILLLGIDEHIRRLRDPAQDIVCTTSNDDARTLVSDPPYRIELSQEKPLVERKALRSRLRSSHRRDQAVKETVLRLLFRVLHHLLAESRFLSDPVQQLLVIIRNIQLLRKTFAYQSAAASEFTAYSYYLLFIIHNGSLLRPLHIYVSCKYSCFNYITLFHFIARKVCCALCKVLQVAARQQ